MNQYTYHTTVLNADGDFRRMIKPSALFRYVEQAAAYHARAYGMDDAFFKAHHTAFLVGKQAAQITKESAFWPRCAFICFSDSLPSSCCLGERRGILLKLDFLLLEK